MAVPPDMESASGGVGGDILRAAAQDVIIAWDLAGLPDHHRPCGGCEHEDLADAVAELREALEASPNPGGGA